MINDRKTTQLPTFVRYEQKSRSGVQVHLLNRHAISFVIKGKRRLYIGDTCYEVQKGDILYLGVGNHYIEDIPEGGVSENLVFYFTTSLLSQIITSLSINFNFNPMPRNGKETSNEADNIYRLDTTTEIIIDSVIKMMNSEELASDQTMQQIKSCELLYNLFNYGDAALSKKLMSLSNSNKDRLEQVVHANIFNNISIDSLAALCNKSLSTFKKDFVKIFNETPHKWIMRQRVIHARLLLVSTHKDLSEICNECKFHNTSHFIKLFRKEYRTTPTLYRQKNRVIEREEA